MTRPEGSRLERLLLRTAHGFWDDNSLARQVIGVVGLAVIIYSILVGTTGGYAASPRQYLGVLVLTGLAAALFLAWLLIRRSMGTTAVPILGALAVVGGLLGGLEPGGGSAFAFVAVYAAGRRLAPRTVAMLTGLSTATLTIAGLASARLSGLGALGLSLGVIVTALGGLNRAAQRRVQEQAELLLAERQVVIEERTRSAALAERTRIAREIHDLLAHSLSGLTVQLEAAHQLLEAHGDPVRVADHVERARGLARGGLEETRRALQTLRGEALPTAELLAELVTTHTGPVELVVTGTPRTLPADVGLTIYRITQEALTNVRRHALGARAEVHLAYEKDSVRLTVSDHASMDSPAPAAAAGSGYGLVGMRERAELLGGELSAGPTRDGWRVGLRVPT